MSIAAEERRRKQAFHRYRRGRPKAHWLLLLTIKRSDGEETETLELRAASKHEAAKKAFQRVQRRLGKLVFEEWENPRLRAKLFRPAGNGNGNGGGIAFVLQTRYAHCEGALRAKRPSQMFREVRGGESRAYH